MTDRIKCAHILVAKQSEAENILTKLKQGQKFGKLAKELSIDAPSAKRNGSLGYFRKGTMIKEFEKVAFSLAVNHVSEPVKTRFGYHIIKRLE